MKTEQLKKQRERLYQRKNRLAAEEASLKIKERKARTKKLIELGGLFVKAKLDHLEIQLLYGALLLAKKELDLNEDITNLWRTEANRCIQSTQTTTHNVILKFNTSLEPKLCKLIRDQGLRFNKFRQEWYGSITEISKLEQILHNVSHEIIKLDGS